MAEDKPLGMSDQDWTNFQSRYRSQNQTPTAAAPNAPPAATPGVPGTPAPALKNPAPAPTPAPTPQIGLGNTVDAPQGGALSHTVTGGGLMAAGQPSAQPQQTPAQQMQGQLRTSILSMLAPQSTPTVQDADIAPQSQAFASAVNARALQARADAVHAANRGGWGNSGAIDQRVGAIGQQAGQAIGANDAALIGQKLETRRQQLNTALQAAQQLGMADEANNLQRQLANLQAGVQTRGQDVQTGLGNLDAATRIYQGDLGALLQREGYGTQERLGNLDADVRRYGIAEQGRLGNLDAAIRNRGVDLGYDQLGVQVGDIQQRMNRDAVLAGLGG